MLTIFTIPKAFNGHIDIIQRNAIKSWTLLEPKCQVILAGDDEGTDLAARDLGVEHIAKLTRNEAAFVTSGSAAGLVLTTAACIAGSDPAKMDRLPHSEGLKNEIIIHRFQRNHYDINIRQAGAQLVEIGGHRTTHPWELEEAIGERTAGIVYFPGRYVGPNILPLERVIETAKARGVPVIVDAAAQMPPSDNFWHYTEMGADLAIFSGGKSLAGPQNTGLILGRWEARATPSGSP